MNRAERRRKEKMAKKLSKAVNPVEQAKSYFSKGCELVSKGQFNDAATQFKRASQANPEATPDLSCFAKYIEARKGDIPLSTCNAMLSPLQHILKTNSIRIPIPPVLIRTLSSHPLELHQDEKWTSLLERRNPALEQLGFNNHEAINAHIENMGLCALVHGGDYALNQMIDLFEKSDVIVRDIGLPSRTADLMSIFKASTDHSIWFSKSLPLTKPRIKNAISRELKRGGKGCGVVILLHLMGLLKEAPSQWLEFMFRDIIIPTLKEASELERFDAGFAIESLTYFTYVQKQESKDHFRDSMSQIWPFMRGMGHAFQKQLSARQVEIEPALEKNAPPTVAFYHHSGGMLGHTEVFLSFLRGISIQETPPLNPVVYLGETGQPEFTKQLDALSIPYVAVDTLNRQSDGYSNTWAAVQVDCKNRDVAAFCFISLVTEMAFAFSIRLAPVQIWWSMKYHGLSMPEIDGYIALGSFQKYKTIDDRDWRICHRSMGSLFDTELTRQANGIRQKFGSDQGTIILGCIGREDKLISAPYIEAVANILDSIPDAIYIWSGRTESKDVQNLIDRSGISEKCQYIGWVNTQLYAQVIDIVVDSFPFASGLTAFESMAAGNPVVGLITPESLGTAYINHMWPGYSGSIDDAEIHAHIKGIFTNKKGASLLPFCETIEQYTQFAIHLGVDQMFRREAGAAAQNFVSTYMHDDLKMASSFTDHIIELIDHKS